MKTVRRAVVGSLFAFALGAAAGSPVLAETGQEGIVARRQEGKPMESARAALRTELAERQDQASSMLCPDEDK